MIPLVLILAATAALALVIMIAARRSTHSVSRSGDNHPTWTTPAAISAATTPAPTAPTRQAAAIAAAVTVEAEGATSHSEATPV